MKKDTRHVGFDVDSEKIRVINRRASPPYSRPQPDGGDNDDEAH